MGMIAVAPEKNHPFTLCQAPFQALGAVKITDEGCQLLVPCLHTHWAPAWQDPQAREEVEREALKAREKSGLWNEQWASHALPEQGAQKGADGRMTRAGG